MESRKCGKCGATWINGQLFWATGARAQEKDLAGLVCNGLGDHQCLNKKRGDESGDTWAKRLAELERLEQDRNL
jgi:hypothetical protein